MACRDTTPQAPRSVEPSPRSLASGYFRLLDADTGLPAVGGVAEVPTVRTEQDWDRIVESARLNGIAALSDAERVQLVAGSLKAYLKSVSSVTLDVRISGESRGKVVETYARDEEGFFTKLSERTTELHATTMPWTNRPYDDATAPDEQRLFFVLANGTSTGVEDWIRRGATWSCSIESAEGYDSFRVNYVMALLSIPHGLLKPSRDGAEVLTVSGGVGEVAYWLDKSTLWPVRIEYPPARDTPASSIAISETELSDEPKRPDGGTKCT
jgi:hypothetical protein